MNRLMKNANTERKWDYVFEMMHS